MRFAILNLRTTPTWWPTTKIPGEWEAHGATIPQVTSEPFTGGAILKKDQREWTSDGRSKRYKLIASINMRVATTCRGCRFLV